MKFSLFCTDTALSQSSIGAQYSKQNMIKFSQCLAELVQKFKFQFSTNCIAKWFYETELREIYLYWFCHAISTFAKVEKQHSSTTTFFLAFCKLNKEWMSQKDWVLRLRKHEKVPNVTEIMLSFKLKKNNNQHLQKSTHAFIALAHKGAQWNGWLWYILNIWYDRQIPDC